MSKDELSEAHHDAVLNRISDVFFALNENWHVLYVNNRALELVNRTREELVGKDFWEAFPDTLASKYEQEWRRAMDAEEPITFKAYYPPLEMWAEVRTYPSDSDLWVYYHDVTEWKERETELGQYETILETIEDGVFVANDEFEFVAVNRAYAEMLGYSPAELVGSDVSMVISDANLEAAVRIGEEVFEGKREVGVVEVELLTASGDAIQTETRFVPFAESDEETSVVGVVRRVSERLAHERALASLHESSRKLLDACTRGDVSEIVAESVTDVFDFSDVAVYLFDEEADALVPTVRSDDVSEHDGALPTGLGESPSSVTADVFATGKTAILEDVGDSDLVVIASDRIQRALFIPLGTYGVLAIGDTEPGTLEEADAELPEIVAAAAEAALRRIDREQRVRSREQTVTTLHEATRELMQAPTKQAISEVAVEAATQLLGLSSVGVFLWNDEEGVLEPSALSRDVHERLDELPTFGPGNSLAWKAFVEEEPAVYDDLREQDTVYNPDSPLRSEMILPLGEHGTFLTGSVTVDSYDDTDVESAKLLAANVSVALDRAEREQNLHEQERTLQRKNHELVELNRINSVIRKTHASLIHATSLGELKQEVCNNLAAEPFDFAWFVARDSESGEIEPQAWSEHRSDLLDALRTLPDVSDGGPTLPVEYTLLSEEPLVVENILQHGDFEEWRKIALNNECQSAISLPVRYGNVTYGAIEVYASDSSTFTGEEQEVLVELTDTIANAINAMQRTEALLASDNTELEFSIQRAEGPLFQLARSLDTRVEMEALMRSDDGSWLLYVLLDDVVPDTVIATAEQFVAVENVTHVRSKSERELFGIELVDLGTLTSLAEHGATLQSLSFEDGEGRVVVRLPQTTDIRVFTETFLDIFPDAEFVRRERAQTSSEPTSVERALSTKLTSRQQEAVELAYRYGYFSSPREHTGDELAEMMEIAPPTFHDHLRKGLYSLLQAVLGETH